MMGDFVGGDLRLGIGDVGLPGVGDNRRLSFGVVGLLGVEGVGLPGVEGVGVPEGEASLPCLLRLHPLQPGPRSQKCFGIFCDPTLSKYLHEIVGNSLP